MSGPRPDISAELLAALADGELSALERERVERWLAENADSHETLEAQESFGPKNTEFWEGVQPPAPSQEQWRQTRDQVGTKVRLARRQDRLRWAATASLFVTAASLIFLMPGPTHNCLNPVLTPVDEIPGSESIESEPFPMASADEVKIVSLPESAAGLILVGEHPLSDSFLRFAKGSEVQFHGIGSDLAGRFPEVISEPSEDVLPMLWAPRAP